MMYRKTFRANLKCVGRQLCTELDLTIPLSEVIVLFELKLYKGYSPIWLFTFCNSKTSSPHPYFSHHGNRKLCMPPRILISPDTLWQFSPSSYLLYYFSVLSLCIKSIFNIFDNVSIYTFVFSGMVSGCLVHHIVRIKEFQNVHL